MLAGSPNERRYARVLLGIVMFFMVAASIQRLVLGTERVHARSTSQEKIEPPRTPTVDVIADATSLDTGQSSEPCTVCRMPPTVRSDAPPWEPWVSLAGPRIMASSGSEALPVYGARIPDGVALLVVNHSMSPTPLRLTLRLARGVYTAERFDFDPNTPVTLPRLERLESVIRGAAGAIVKPGWLMPETAAVYRFTNRSAETQAAFHRVRVAVYSIVRSRPAEFRRLMIPLRECESNIAVLSYGILPGQRYDCLRYIHRALLTVAHAQALSRNSRSEGRLQKGMLDAFGPLAASLDHLEETLTELSAACLNLVPGLIIEAPDPEHPDTRIVTVALTNAGHHAVSCVKIGANAPAGCTVRPAEEALFLDLKPGETARATFIVRGEDLAPEDSVGADIAWFAAHVPAHLRLKPVSRPST